MLAIDIPNYPIWLLHTAKGSAFPDVWHQLLVLFSLNLQVPNNIMYPLCNRTIVCYNYTVVK